MISFALAVALAASPASMLSLKDPPEKPVQLAERLNHMPEPGRHPFVFVQGIQRRFYLPEPVMRRYNLLPGDVIKPAAARQIARDLGLADYSPEEMQRLEELEKQDPFQ